MIQPERRLSNPLADASRKSVDAHHLSNFRLLSQSQRIFDIDA